MDVEGLVGFLDHHEVLEPDLAVLVHVGPSAGDLHGDIALGLAPALVLLREQVLLESVLPVHVEPVDHAADCRSFDPDRGVPPIAELTLSEVLVSDVEPAHVSHFPVHDGYLAVVPVVLLGAEQAGRQGMEQGDLGSGVLELVENQSSGLYAERIYHEPDLHSLSRLLLEELQYLVSEGVAADDVVFHVDVFLCSFYVPLQVFELGVPLGVQLDLVAVREYGTHALQCFRDIFIINRQRVSRHGFLLLVIYLLVLVPEPECVLGIERLPQDKVADESHQGGDQEDQGPEEGLPRIMPFQNDYESHQHGVDGIDRPVEVFNEDVYQHATRQSVIIGYTLRDSDALTAASSPTSLMASSSYPGSAVLSSGDSKVSSSGSSSVLSGEWLFTM